MVHWRCAMHPIMHWHVAMRREAALTREAALNWHRAVRRSHVPRRGGLMGRLCERRDRDEWHCHREGYCPPHCRSPNRNFGHLYGCGRFGCMIGIIHAANPALMNADTDKHPVEPTRRLVAGEVLFRQGDPAL